MVYGDDDSVVVDCDTKIDPPVATSPVSVAVHVRARLAEGNGQIVRVVGREPSRKDEAHEPAARFSQLQRIACQRGAMCVHAPTHGAPIVSS